jgi:hypothetical protein
VAPGGIKGFGRDLGGLGGGIVASKRGLAGTGGAIDGSRRDSTGLGGGCLGRGVSMRIGVSRRDSGGLGGIIDSSKRDSSRLEGIVAPRRDSSKAGGGIEGFGCVHAVARFLGGTLGCNSCKAFLFDFDLPRQAMQVLKTLLPGLAEALARKEESGSFWIQAEQYFEAIPDVKARGLQV